MVARLFRWALFVLAGAAVCIAVAHLGLTQAVDAAVSREALRLARDAPLLTDAMRVATFLGDWPVRLVVIAIGVIVLLRRGWARGASYLVYTCALTWALNAWVLKPWLARARPPEAALLPDRLDPFSLPSGHAASAAALAVAIGLLGAMLWRDRRRAIWAVAAGMAALIGVSRVWLGAHWPSDVVAGWLWGAGLALLLAAVLRPVRARR